MDSSRHGSDSDEHEPGSVPGGVSGLDPARRSAIDGRVAFRRVRRLSTYGGSALVLGILAVVAWSFIHSAIAGSQGSPMAPFDKMHPAVTDLHPSAIAVDAAGSLYALDVNPPARIVKLSPSGATTHVMKVVTSAFPITSGVEFVIAAGGQPYLAELALPSTVARLPVGHRAGASWKASTPDSMINDVFDTALAIDTWGRIYLGGYRYGNNDEHYPFWQAYTSNGRLIQYWQGTVKNATDAGMAVDKSGNVYLGDQAGNRLQSFTPAGKLRWTWTRTTHYSGLGISGPPGVALDQAGNVYMAGNATFLVEKISPSGRWLSAWPVPRGTSAFNMPTGLAVDHQGSVYVVAEIDNTGPIFKYSSAGKPLAMWK
jgi:hypothetical protein